MIDSFIKKIEEDTNTVISPGSSYRNKIEAKFKLLHGNSLIKSTIENRITDVKNWKGSLAELLITSLFSETGFDFESEKVVARDDTLLKAISPKPDIFLPSPYNLFIEIKKFTDGNKRITDNIISIVKQKHNVEITASYKYDIHINNKIAVAKEIEDLSKAIKQKIPVHYSTNFSDLSFRIYYNNPRILLSEHSNNEYSFANNFKYFILKNADQLIMNKGNILAYVISPKYNFNFFINNNFHVSLRALARRVFIELTKKHLEISDIYPEWNTKVKISQVTRRITGLLFYIDEIEKPDKVFFFTNPNANIKNKEEVGIKQLRLTFQSRLIDLGHEYIYDDFVNDNY